ncbi:MAG TPA: methyltransferase domain-containing protein [Gaiellaceae bacterium]|nr:methyltransferase domain-containing protein [Gaiellaceae bacterium]
MPRRVELDLALAGLALARNWLVGEPVRVRRILDEVSRLVLARPDDWFDVPERDLVEGYDEWSATYDQPTNPILQLEEPAVRSIIDALDPGAALDAACGTGRHAAVLRELGHRVTGVDASTAMLERARRRVPDAELVYADLTRLPLASGTFDVAVCALALTHFPDLSPVVGELARVVRPEGRIIISDVHPVFVALGAQARYGTESGEPAYIRNYVHWPGAYLRAFKANQMTVLECHDVPYRRQEVELWVERVALDGEVVAAALEGLPAVIVWDLVRDAV